MLVPCVLALLFTLVHSFCGHGTSLDPHTDLDYHTKSDDTDWGYDGLSNGPVNWFSSSRPWNRNCSFLSTQSPRNFPDFVKTTPSFYMMNIPPRSLQVEHKNLTVEIFDEHHASFGNLTLGTGEVFDLQQFHFHTPSEHRIHSEYSPVEVHFVHESKSQEGKLVVVAMLFELRAETKDEPWRSLLDAKNLNDKIPLVGDKATTPALNFASVMENIQSDVYQYDDGSLTTPPCSGSVTFILSASKIELSWLHYNNLKALVKFNSRPVQNNFPFENALFVAAEDICSSSTEVKVKGVKEEENQKLLTNEQEVLEDMTHELL